MHYQIIKIYFENLNAFFWLVECNAAQNCSNQGICGPDGACDCDCGFYMEDCSSKLKKLYFVSKIVLTYQKKNCSLIPKNCEFKTKGQELIQKNKLFKQEKDRIIFETSTFLTCY